MSTLEAWPLVGRERQLQALEETLQAADHPAVVLAGPPGVGKSRLAMESLGRARARGWLVQHAVATQAAATIPFGALAQLLPDLPSGAERAAVLRGAVEAVRGRAAGRPALLVVDDANLLDDASAALLYQVATEGAARVVVTLQTGDPKPDPLGTLLKEGAAIRIELSPLTGDELATLLARVLGAQVERATVHRLERVSGGNPLFLRELVTSGVDSGSLVSANGIWRWRGPLVPGRGLLELIGGRLAQIDQAELSVLEHLAIGEPLAPEVLETCFSPALVVVAERDGWLAANVEGRRVEVRLAHPLYAEVLRSRIPPLGARAIRRRLAEAMCSLGGSSAEDLLRIVTWRLDGGQQPSVDELDRAANVAMGAFDYRLAERLARARLDAGARFETTMLLARALRGQSRMEETEAVFASLAERASPAEQARLAPERARNLLLGLGRPAEAEQTLQHAERSAPDEATRDLLAATRALFLLAAGRSTDAEALAAKVLGHPSAAQRAVVDASVVVASAGLQLGSLSQARTAADRALDLAAKTRAETRSLIELQDFVVSADQVDGHLTKSERGAAQGYRLALDEGNEPARAVWAFRLGVLALLTGRVASARTWLEEAVSSMEDVDHFRLSRCLAVLAEVYAISGDLDKARPLLTRATNTSAALVAVNRVWCELSEAWLLACGGELSGACRVAMTIADETHGLGYKHLESEALYATARFGSAELVVDRLNAVTADMDARLIRTWAEHVRAQARRDGAALDAVGRTLEDMGAQLLAGEAATEAAAIYRENGLRARAAESHAAAARRLRKCEGARTPALTRLSSEQLLTNREQEIATLAGQGLSSRVIAERLFVSVRTVDNHLRQIYGKLGISSRAELVEEGDRTRR